VWWYLLVIPACNSSAWEAEAEGSQVYANLGLIVRSCLKKKREKIVMYKIDRN
jgi:hypothetical protein